MRVPRHRIRLKKKKKKTKRNETCECLDSFLFLLNERKRPATMIAAVCGRVQLLQRYYYLLSRRTLGKKKTTKYYVLKALENYTTITYVNVCVCVYCLMTELILY